MAVGYGENRYAKYGRPTLDLIFTGPKKSLTDKPSNVTVEFTRTQDTQASYYKSDGTIGYASTDVARFDHDPTTGESLGLLIEEARTNSLEYSEDISNAYWTKQECSLGATTTAPDGTNSAYLVIPSTTNTNLHRLRTGTGALNQQRSQSCYAKAGGYNYVFFRSQNTDVIFDLSTGLASNANGEMIPMGNGWYRCIFTGSAFLGSNLGFGVSPLSDGTGAGNGTDGVYLWGLQWEDLATFATSYIPTAGATATRAADVASITGTNFSNWYNQSEGSLFAQYIFNGGTEGNFNIWNGLGNDLNYWTVGVIDSAGGVMGLQTRSSQGTSSSTNNKGRIDRDSNLGEVIKTAAAINTDDFAAFTSSSSGDTNLNTGSTVPAAGGYLPPSVDRFILTHDLAASIHISRLTYWPTRLPDSDLQRLTK